MTNKQWTELMNDTNLPWPVIIDDTLKQYFTDKVADEVFDQILDAAWDHHLSLRHGDEKKPGRMEAIEILDDASDVKSYVLITCDENGAADMRLTGTGKEIMALLISGSAQFIRNAGNDAPDRMKAGVVRMFKADFINCLKTVLEDDND